MQFLQAAFVDVHHVTGLVLVDLDIPFQAWIESKVIHRELSCKERSRQVVVTRGYKHSHIGISRHSLPQCIACIRMAFASGSPVPRLFDSTENVILKIRLVAADFTAIVAVERVVGAHQQGHAWIMLWPLVDGHRGLVDSLESTVEPAHCPFFASQQFFAKFFFFFPQIAILNIVFRQSG